MHDRVIRENVKHVLAFGSCDVVFIQQLCCELRTINAARCSAFSPERGRELWPERPYLRALAGSLLPPVFAGPHELLVSAAKEISGTVSGFYEARTDVVL